MGEPSNNELNDKIADIREWLVRIDTKVDYFNEVKHTADRAHEKADEALALAKESRALRHESKYEMVMGRNSHGRRVGDLGNCAIFMSPFGESPAGFLYTQN
ncbi:hypothetical protein ABE068_20625 [Bacillus glycinifermentans]|uniref:Uncharacterized protein n=1 Tax=Bacillus glycinifermentans TaxID=1664069 RepID=A0ABU6GX54_9BACI|nr:hypothetical protein [Bacillus glycinifermentans]MEC0483362.1 hypothetical protein [Bacillus glycinifermentans]